MWLNRSFSHLLAILAVAALLCCVAYGCGSDAPTGPPPTVSLPELFGSQLYRADGSAVGVATLNSVSIIGIYFASSGCPACGAFTPVLVDAYDQLRDDGRSFEVVLVSSESSDPSLFDYMVDGGMGWLAVSSQSNRINTLAQRYNVQWIPTLVIIDGAANTISLNGRNELTARGTAAYDDWLAASGGG
jgi:hypothetical protein